MANSKKKAKNQPVACTAQASQFQCSDVVGPSFMIKTCKTYVSKKTPQDQPRVGETPPVFAGRLGVDGSAGHRSDAKVFVNLCWIIAKVCKHVVGFGMILFCLCFRVLFDINVLDRFMKRCFQTHHVLDTTGEALESEIGYCNWRIQTPKWL